MIRTGVTATFGAIMLAATAQAQTVEGPSGSRLADAPEANQAMAVGESETAATREYKAAQAEAMRNASKDLSGDADIDYARQMIAYHQGGIEMARVLLTHGKDAALRRSAEKMIVEQQKQIGELQLWLQTQRR
jgi:uncharacterized protein (DUF305 family)